MKVEIKIEAQSRLALIKEINDIIELVKNELDYPICKGCKTCKDMRKGCQVGGGSSEPGLESSWKLSRHLKEHLKICASKNKK